MLYFIFAWIILLVACSTIGTALLQVVQAVSLARRGDRWIASLWLGVVILAIALLATSCLVPLSPQAGAVVIAGLMAISISIQVTRTELRNLWSAFSRRSVLAILMAVLGVAAVMARPVTWHDTGFYHYSVIRWLEQFGAVPGVALLFSNLGFTSSWFALAAPFSPEAFAAQTTAVANGFICLIAVLHCWMSVNYSIHRKAKLSDRFILSFSLLLLLVLAGAKTIQEILISPSPDFAIILLTAAIAWMILLIAEQPTLSGQASKLPGLDERILPLILGVGSVTIKLTAMPLLGMTGLFFVASRGWRVNRIGLAGAIALLLLSPLLIHSIITSGCPLYPSSLLCLNLPWSPTVASVEAVAKGTHDWMSWYSTTGSHSWFWAIGRFLQTPRGQLTALLLLAAVLFMVITLKLITAARSGSSVWLLAIALSGILFILLTAPWFRFGLPYLLLLLSLFTTLLYHTQAEPIIAKIFQRLSHHYSSQSHLLQRGIGLGCTALVFLLVAKADVRSHLLLPPPLKRVPIAQKQVNNITYFVPTQEKFCWATPIPCAFEVPQDVILRDPARGIAGGFVRVRHR